MASWRIATSHVVYALEPYILVESLGKSQDRENVIHRWIKHSKDNTSENLSDDDWEESYLPLNETERRDIPIPELPMLFDPAHLTRRFAAQRSRFIIFGSAWSYLVDMLGRPNSPIRKILIDAQSCQRLRRELRDAGITESVIFPDMDGLGREMKQRWNDLIRSKS